ncbi:MAG: glycosyltransferase [Gemmatimonadaceae bacterium]|nr:glycosyltransferase [Gemmatimonadaceae bacterium]
MSESHLGVSDVSAPKDAALTLVVPCFNEAARLDGAAFRAALQRDAWLRVLFVDDGSTDDTAVMLDNLAASVPNRISVLHLARNSGKAEAVRQGLAQAMTQSALCGFWDADLAAPLEEVASLRQLLCERPTIDWVFGIRLRALGRNIHRRALRHYLGRLFATCSSILLGIDSYDTQCGAKLFRSTSLLQEVLSTPFRSRWIFDVEMLTRAVFVLSNTTRRLTDVVYEAPLAQWEHRSGSKVRPGDFVRACMELLHLRRERAHWRPALPPITRPTRP